MSKSPLRSHERKLKKLDKKIEKANKYDSHTGDKDYDYLADLQRQKKDLVASHTDTNTKRTEEEDTQVREDEDAAQGSAIEMQSPLHGYVDASDMVDPNPPTAHMWTKVFDAASDAYKSAITPKDPCAGLTGETLAKCKNANYEAKSKDNGTKGDGSEDDSPTPDEALAKSISEDQVTPGTFRYKELHPDSKPGFDKQNAMVYYDKEGNITHKRSKTTNKWIAVSDIHEF